MKTVARTKEFVYLLRELDLFTDHPSCLYKIGMTTTTVLNRKSQYKAGNARRVETLFVIQVEDAQAIETELHRKFQSHRIKGLGGGDEWFYFKPNEVPEVIVAFKKYGTPESQFRYVRLKKLIRSPGAVRRVLTPSPGFASWAERKRWIVLLLILFPPLGVVLLNESKAPRPVKRFVTGLSVVWFPVLIYLLRGFFR
ncbi:GIY-YIG nuclease family protein [Leptolyngbya sp. AN03gr2]|uniref:GIY-YIG nuclease family protein n=1 Tax=Leptolyngbya sp. AN03gr2 TaxID=3423364 RepID=UPI003D319AF1